MVHAHRRLYADVGTLKTWSQRGRQTFYLQIRDDIFHNRIVLADAEIVFAAALACQLHFGPWVGGRGMSEYISQVDSNRMRTPAVGSNVEEVHKMCAGRCIGGLNASLLVQGGC